MLKKEFTFTDLDGNEVTETYYFGINTAELAKMAMTHDGDIIQYLEAIVNDKKGAEIIAAFEDIVRISVGQRSPDGRFFLKTDEIRQQFMGTEAYAQFFLELVTNADVAAEFVKGIMPANLAEKAAAIQGMKKSKIIETELPVEQRALTIDDFTEDQLTEMSLDDLFKLRAGELYVDNRLDKKPLTVDDFSSEELRAMTQQEFDKIAGTDPKKWSKRVLIVAMQRRAK